MGPPPAALEGQPAVPARGALHALAGRRRLEAERESSQGRPGDTVTIASAELPF